MSPTTRDDPRSLERFRSYLHLLARLRLQGDQRKRINPSDLVQQTLFEASQQRERFTGGSPAETASWLKRILAHNLGHAFRALHRDEDTILESAPRPTTREADQKDPSIILAEAMVQLPEAEREALVLQHWHGLPLAEIAARLERTPVGVAGLLKRALARLRVVLRAPV
jgi:RNA polymerase sigma-70 factor (ECF subfamily)